MTLQAEQFQRELILSLTATKHLRDRNFTEETIKKFDVGFCPVYTSYHFDLLAGRVIVPIYDVYGNQVAFAGRKLESYGSEVNKCYQSRTSKLVGLNKFLKWKTSKWINTPYKKADHLYNLNNAKEYIYKLGFCVIVEGYYDVMRLHQLGFKNVVALCGTSLTDRQCELIYRYCDKILLMLDGDNAGKEATNKAIDKARRKNIFANVVDLPENIDPDDLDEDTLECIYAEMAKAEEEVYIKI